VSTDNVRGGVAHDASKDETDDNGVVGVSEDAGDEVGHKVDGERQVGDEQDANATSDVLK
jgi:hypothetical protein